MAWQDELCAVTRVMVGDYAGTTYSSGNLEMVLVVSALQVSNAMNFNVAYDVDIPNVNIIPDPTFIGDPITKVGGTRDENFMNLVCMKAACLLDKGEARVAATQSIRVQDGKSSVDLTGIAKAKLELLARGGWCQAYEDAKMEYLAGQTRLVGAAILTPFRVFAYGGGFFESVPGWGRHQPYY